MKSMAVFLASLVAGSVLANNLTVTNVTVLNAANGVADVRFDLSWDNAWHSSWPEYGGALNMTNWDAAWVFVKFRCAGGQWQHAILNASGHVATGGTQIESGANPAGQPVGAFVHRAADSNGTLNCPQMSLKWNYAATGLGGTNAVDVSVHAIEMVYIPQGAFYVGSGGTEYNAFYAGTNSTQPYQIASETAIPVGTNGLNHVNNNGLYNGEIYNYLNGYYSTAGDWIGPIPDGFPKGYNAFYMMKYEISQGQYADFLNFVDPGMAATRFMNNYGNTRNTISKTGMVYTCAAPDRACNYLSWPDLLTYLKWAALRPMDELEYEKACRGPVYPVPNEYAWGDTLMTPMTGFGGVDGSGTETATPTNANLNISISGPVRVGIFATTTSGRRDAGAGYYGAMNLADNVMELVVATGDATGRAFTNEPGDGNEWTPASTWPSNGAGLGLRGSFSLASNLGQTSGRFFALWNSLSRQAVNGGRGVRSAP
jgi:formylglycine-generating enzyme required for sulfatase activity